MGNGTSGLVNDLSSEIGTAPSVYLRQTFSVSAANAASSQNIILDVDYNDGFVAYLNGVEILRKNAGGTGAFMFHDQGAFNAHSSGTTETYTIGIAADLLKEGENLLAVQAHAQAVTDALGNYVSDGTLFIDAALRMSGGTQLATSSGPWDYQIGHFEPSGGLVDHSLFQPSTSQPDPFLWTLVGFNDSSWLTGPGGIGFEDNDDNTDVGDLMKGIATSLYMRRSFTIDASIASSSTPLTFTVDYDDGYIAYLNGVEISRSSNMGSPGDFYAHDAPSGGSHEAGRTIEANTLSAANSLLVEGENVLSIQVHNVRLTSSDMTMIADLDLGATPLVNYSDDWNYFIGTEEPCPPPEAVTAEDPTSDFVDWVELENTGSTAVSLNGWSLTDNPDNPDKWVFPDVTIQPNEHKVILCTGLDMTNTVASYLHTDFNLSAGGEYIGLYSPGEVLVSEIAPEYPKQDWRYTYGWDSASSSYKYFKEATPGKTNSTNVFAALPESPTASHESGFYDSGISVSLSAVAPATEIYYTRDGSTPNTTLGTRYTTPLTFSSAGVLRAVAVTAEGVESDPATYNYLVNVPPAMKTLPVICLTGDWDTSINMPHGIAAVHGGRWVNRNWKANGPDDYNNPMIHGRPYERKIHLNVLYSDTFNNTNYQANCGIRLAGSRHGRPKFKGENPRSEEESMDGRWDDGPFDNKPQFNLFFRDEYGKSRLKHPIFGDPDTNLKSIRLRAGKNDWQTPFVRDELARRLSSNIGLVCSVGNIVGLYVNGEYRHYYNPCQRYDEHFLQEAHGTSRDFDIIIRSDVSEGDKIAFNEMFSFATSNDLSDPSNYRAMERRLDIEKFIDYLLIQCYSGNYDWPNNNWIAAKERSSFGRFRFYVWDLEWGLKSNPTGINNFTGDGHLSESAAQSKMLNNGNDEIPKIYRALRASATFRQHFYDRAWKHFSPGGALDTVTALASHDALMSEFEAILQYTHALPPPTETRDFVSQREEPFIQQLRDENLWFDVEPPIFSEPGGTTTNGAQIALTNPNSSGIIYYALDGEDPRGFGGTVVGTEYNAPITIDRSRHIKARILKNGVWGALAEETYLTLHPKLLISEIMYNPADPEEGSVYDNDDFEFIELYNSDSSAIPLPPIVIDNGIAFNFSGTEIDSIASGEYIVLVRNLDAFATRYDTNDIIVAGTYTDKLSNGGEKLELLHDNYGILVKGSFSDGWYDHTDGDGYSLNLRNLSSPGVFDEKASWKPSSVYGGSPGKPDPDSVPEPGTVVINELLSHTDASAVGDWVELFNTSDEPIDISGWTLSDDHTNLVKYVIPDGITVDAYGYVTFNAFNHFDTPAARVPFAFSEHGDEAILTSPVDGNGRLTGYRHDVDFEGAEREYTFGRYTRSDGKNDWTTLSTGTPAAANAYPKVGPVVIYEIGYQLATNAVEFIQLYNISDADLPLYEPTVPTNTWKISGGIDFTFPQNVNLPAFSALILCAGDPASFRSTHAIPSGIQIFGPFEGALDNQGDSIKLFRPGNTDELGTPWIEIDRVKYNNKDPWPTITNGMTSAIQRIYNFNYGNDPINWMLGPADSNPKPTRRMDSDLDGLPDQWEAEHALLYHQPGDGSIDVDFDTMDNYAEYIAGTNPNDSNSCFRLETDLIHGEFVVKFDSVPALGNSYDGMRREYTIEYSSEPASPYENLPGAEALPATGNTISFTNAIPANAAFFRGKVRLVPEGK